MHYQIDPNDKKRHFIKLQHPEKYSGVPTNQSSEVKSGWKEFLDEKQLISQQARIDLLKTQAQWINCDIQAFDLSILKEEDPDDNYKVIIVDPPWDIHMNLPYETINDMEVLKALNGLQEV